MDTPTTPPPTHGPHRPPVRPALVLAGVLALLALAAFPGRESLYRSVAGTVASSAAGPVAGLVAEAGLLVLVATAALLALRGWVRDRRSFWTLASAGVGVVAAYLMSEGVKLAVAQQRPCRVVEVETVLACPGVGDWSWPSNHSVLAAAFATACVLAAARTAWFAVPAALLIAASRVAAGVHYVHDVASGLAFGLLVTVAAVLLLRPLVDRLPQRLTATAPGRAGAATPAGPRPAHRRGWSA